MSCVGRPIRTAAVAAALVLSACAGEPVRLGSALPAGASWAEARDITAKACGFQLMLLIPIMINDRQERAYQSLLAQAGPDVVTDVAIEESWSYAFIGTIYCTRLRAKAVPARPAPATPALPQPVVEGVPPAPAPGEPAAPPPAASPPAASAPVPPQTVPSAGPRVMEAGVTARLRPGATVRTRAMPEGTVVPGVAAGAPVVLKAPVRNAAGSWWYVTSPTGSGWVREAELEPVLP